MVKDIDCYCYSRSCSCNCSCNSGSVSDSLGLESTLFHDTVGSLANTLLEREELIINKLNLLVCIVILNYLVDWQVIGYCCCRECSTCRSLFYIWI